MNMSAMVSDIAARRTTGRYVSSMKEDYVAVI
jgi:hypothetical protein